MKKFLAFTIVILSMISLFTINIKADNDIKIIINNQTLQTDTPPVIVDGRTLVPLRAIGEAMGCEVTWVAATRTANLKNETTIVSMQIGNQWVTKVKRVGDGAQTVKEIDVPPMLINDRTYIPARAFAEALDAMVAWDAGSRTVIIVFDTTVQYAGNLTVSTFAGNGERAHYDSTTAMMSFVSPESIDIAADGSIYVADSGKIRRIKDGKSTTVEFEPSYITPAAIRCFGNDVYALTHEFQDESGKKFYGIVKLADGAAEGIFITEAAYSKISDFAFANDGTMYLLQNNVGVGQNYIGKLNVSTGQIETLKDVDAGVACITVDKNGNLYVGNSVKGSIWHYNVGTGSFRLFAGADNKTKFVDGPNPMFFEPRQLRYKDGALYVLDFNLFRKITINSSDLPIMCETLAGKVVAEQSPETKNGKASDCEIAQSYLMDFAVTGDGLIFTDPKWAVLREVK